MGTSKNQPSFIWLVFLLVILLNENKVHEVSYVKWNNCIIKIKSFYHLEETSIVLTIYS